MPRTPVPQTPPAQELAAQPIMPSPQETVTIQTSQPDWGYEVTASPNIGTNNYIWNTSYGSLSGTTVAYEPMYYGGGPLFTQAVASQPEEAPSPRRTNRNALRGFLFEDPTPRHRFKVRDTLKVNTMNFAPDIMNGEKCIIKALVGSHSYLTTILEGRYGGIDIEFDENQLKKIIKRNLPEWW